MNDFENDGRDYGENIDEGPTNVESEGSGFSSEPDSKNVTSKKREFDRQDQKKTDVIKKVIKKQQPEKSSVGSNSGKCVCKVPYRRRGKSQNKELKMEKKLKKQTRKRRKEGKKKKRRFANSFIIFYLEMFYKNPKKCITEVACEAGKAWSSLSSKQKEEYKNKAKKGLSMKIMKKSKKKFKELKQPKS